MRVISPFAAACCILSVLSSFAGSVCAQNTEPVFTVVSDFDDDSVAASITDVRNVPLADCSAGRVELRQRGPGSMGIDVGATVPGASAACDFLLRVPVRFEQADRVAAFARVKGASMRLAFRIRDARNRRFETVPQTVNRVHEWQPVSAPLGPNDLRPLVEGDKPVWPIEIAGCRVETDEIGRQVLYLDDLQVEHLVSRSETVRGEFNFSEPTRIFSPGTTVRAGLLLENRSRRAAAAVNVELTWLRSDGVKVKTEEKSGISFPASRGEFRSRQELSFSQRLDEPGLYRLVAVVRSAGWLSAARFETSIAVTPTNRNLPRGRETFFSVLANLWRESPADQLLEISVARDLGVQLLALEIPWSRVQPAADRYQFETLDRLVEAVASRDMAAMLCLSEPPAWAMAAENPAQAQTAFIAELAKRYRDRMKHIEAAPEALGNDPAAAILAIQQAATAVSPEVHVAVRANKPAGNAFDKPFSTPASGTTAPGGATAIRRVFESGDDLWNAAATLSKFAVDHKHVWTDADWWRFTLPPRLGAGYFSDSEDVLRMCVAAAAAGVGGGMWIDLRDDDNDPANPSVLRGMVSRDFSPKNSLLGFASTVGLLGGLHYAGPVRGAPPEFDSAMFIGADRQVAVLMPLPNRVLPALLAPIAGVKGTITVSDFQRIRQRVIGPFRWPLVPALSHPLFIELSLANAEPEPQLSLRKPWLRLPSRVYLDKETEFTVEIAPPIDVRGGYLRLLLPDKSPLQSKFGARQLAASADELVSQPIKLTADEKSPWDRVVATVQVSLDGRAPTVEVPLEVRRQCAVRPLTGSLSPEPESTVLTLAGPEKSTATAQVAVAYAPDQLRFAFRIKDDRFMPFKATSGSGFTGDELWVGLAALDANTSIQARLAPMLKGTVVTPLFGVADDQTRQWRVECEEVSADTRVIQLSVPAAALGQSRLSAGSQLLFAATYWDDDTAGGSRELHTAGSGLDGRRTTEGYLLLRCADK